MSNRFKKTSRMQGSNLYAVRTFARQILFSKLLWWILEAWRHTATRHDEYWSVLKLLYTALLSRYFALKVPYYVCSPHNIQNSVFVHVLAQRKAILEIRISQMFPRPNCKRLLKKHVCFTFHGRTQNTDSPNNMRSKCISDDWWDLTGNSIRLTASSVNNC